MRRFPLLALLALGGRPAAAGPLLDKLRERRAERRGSAETDEGDLSHGMSDAGPFPLPSGASVQRDIAYGNEAEQRLDVYRPGDAKSAPVLFMVHGGGWSRGDKGQWRTIKNKVTHWVGRGYVVVSINYRMIPKANPLQQADDVAKALAFAQDKAASWGADPARFVVMGHSAGAHLVALLTADPRIAERYGAKPWLGTVTLDSAAFDVEEIMRGRHFGLYDKAFGDDEQLWRDASPTQRLKGKPAAPMLVVCSTRRGDACPQGQAFAAKANGLGGRVKVLPLDVSHAQANDMVGAPGAFTNEVEAFMRSLGLS